MDINIEISNFQKKIVEVIAASNMPPIIVRLVLQNICSDLLALEKQIAQNEAAQAAAQKGEDNG